MDEQEPSLYTTLTSFALPTNMTDSCSYESLPSSLLVCSCEAAEINHREMRKLPRINATEQEILDATYQEINTNIVQLADQLKEVKGQ